MINICRRHKSQSPELLWWVGRKKEEISFSPSQNTLNMFHCCFSSSHCDALKFAIQSQQVRYNHHATDLLLKQLPSNENSVEAVLSLVPVLYFAAKDSMSDFWKVALWCSVFPETHVDLIGIIDYTHHGHKKAKSSMIAEQHSKYLCILTTIGNIFNYLITLFVISRFLCDISQWK